tara:strand:- start:682 stop:1092 length:411 start_codon:yes stop_codon:yes gene_type:complete
MESLYYTEGKIFFSYLLKKEPPESLINNYCIALRKNFNDPPPLRFNKLVHLLPNLLYLIDPILRPKTNALNQFKIRLDLAFVILDASPEGKDLFYNYDDKNRIGLIIQFLIRILLEILIFPFRLLPFSTLVKYERT